METVEPQYNSYPTFDTSHGRSTLGLRANVTWHEDPRKLMIALARYKFVSKMLFGKKHALEIGCGDAFGTRLVQQEVDKVTVTDIDPVFINDVKARMDPDWPLDCRVHNMLESSVNGDFDAAYSLDVIEHIKPSEEVVFLKNIIGSLKGSGVVILGSPSKESQIHASEGSIQGHVNCKTAVELKKLLIGLFDEVFIFSMNDEVIHTGFYPMAHYLFAVCTIKR